MSNPTNNRTFVRRGETLGTSRNLVCFFAEVTGKCTSNGIK
jgi:hypothetical protein